MNNDFIARKGYDRPVSMSCPAGASTTIFTEKVPNGTHLRLTHLSNYAQDAASWGLLTWSIRVNDVPTKFYGSFSDWYGDLSQMHEMGDPILAQPGDTITVIVTNAAGVDYIAGIGFRGAFGSPVRGR